MPRKKANPPALPPAPTKLNTTFKGNRLLVAHWSNARLTCREAILAKCASCMAYYADGRQDCHIPTCPLYPFQPYRSRKTTSKEGK